MGSWSYSRCLYEGYREKIVLDGQCIKCRGLGAQNRRRNTKKGVFGALLPQAQARFDSFRMYLAGKRVNIWKVATAHWIPKRDAKTRNFWALFFVGLPSRATCHWAQSSKSCWWFQPI